MGSNPGSIDDILQLSFNLSRQYQSANIVFTSKVSNSVYCDWNYVSSTYTSSSSSLWTANLMELSQVCRTRLRARLGLNTALSQCFTRTETSTKDIYTAIITITTQQIKNSIRGENVVKTTKTALKLTIQLPRFKTLNATTIDVNGVPDFFNGSNVYYFVTCCLNHSTPTHM